MTQAPGGTSLMHAWCVRHSLSYQQKQRVLHTEKLHEKAQVLGVQGRKCTAGTAEGLAREKKHRKQMEKSKYKGQNGRMERRERV